MRLLKFAPTMTPQAVARAGHDGFRAKQSVIVPGLSDLALAKGAGLVPRPVLMQVVAGLQRKRR